MITIYFPSMYTSLQMHLYQYQIVLSTSFATKKTPPVKNSPKKGMMGGTHCFSWMVDASSTWHGWSKDCRRKWNKKTRNNSNNVSHLCQEIVFMSPWESSNAPHHRTLGFCWKIYFRVSFPNLQMKSYFSIVVVMFSDALNFISTASFKSPHLRWVESSFAVPCDVWNRILIWTKKQPTNTWYCIK